MTFYYVFLNICKKNISKVLSFWYMVSWCVGFYEGHFLKLSSLSARMHTLVGARMRGCADSINPLWDQPFEQGMIIYISISWYLSFHWGCHFRNLGGVLDESGWYFRKFGGVLDERGWHFTKLGDVLLCVFEHLQKKHIKSIEFLIHGQLMCRFLRGSFSEIELPLS